MRKLNAAGLILGFVAIVLVFIEFIAFAETTFLPFMALLLIVGVVLLGVDRWGGDSRYGPVAITALWTIYWGFAASGLFRAASFFAVGVVLGDGGARQLAEGIMYGYLCFAFLIGVLGVANLIRFFVKLFSLPKLGSSNR